MGWSYRFMIGITVLALGTIALAQDAQNDEQIDSAEAAIAKAFEYTGFDRLEGYPGAARTSALRVTIAADSTPYVGKLISGNEIWLVTLPDVPLPAIGRPGGRTTASTFDVYLDSQKGNLLKICSRFADSSFMVPGVDPPDSSGPKKMISATGDTVIFGVFPIGPKIGEKEPLLAQWGFAGLPDFPPAPFLDVMQHSCVEMTKCIRLEAVYILRQTGRGQPAALWLTWLHGYPRVTRSGSKSAPREAFLLTGLVTSDGRLGECLDSEQSTWATFVGELPPAGRRYQQFIRPGAVPRETVTDDRSSIMMGIAPPGELLVTDPAGRRTGLDPLTGRSFEEIPRASYYDDSIGDPDGTAMMEARGFHARRPLSGDYKLTVTGTADGDYSLGCHFYDICDSIAVFDFDRAPITVGGVHNYMLTIDRLSASKSCARGAFEGGGDESPNADRLLTYASIASDSGAFPAGTSAFSLVIVYNRAVLPETFTATLNDTEVSDLFKPVAEGSEVVNVPLEAGLNELVLSVQGMIDDVAVKDTDALVFIVDEP
ncbi:MAG: hypothetical protein JSW34_09935 [Candidatus Zixiibacteriota bacterium]|nr:MAG: hypothetical protein JSW34_09935 [candidate division Zixibacteria bacterium]